ncbi:glycosyltransferase family A protein [Pedobacter sp. PLR]|uniref:glycosyltransferase family A protein n=1 Tax=Pedobacter sp. PLR TaxID=2994465 RepID=UPI0022470A1B|nr:glycosyltransferase family A protein [Pedobacter sp. PLR]MCX2451956.1 glycosyltransferase family A protein [Pedobacter sp. PLR]
MNSNPSLISCICITGDKPFELQRALSCFIKQDYPNTELVISYPKDDSPTIDILNQLRKNYVTKIIRLERDRADTTSSARNAAIEIANGEFICMWHDEHWHHSNRITTQYSVLENGPFRCSFLSKILLYDLKYQMTYESRFKTWPESLLCDKQIMLEACLTYLEEPNAREINSYLFSKNVLYQISNASHLYIYIFDRLWKNRRSHHFKFPNAEGLTDINETIQDIIELDQYLLENKYKD